MTQQPKHCLQMLAERYPQLVVPIAPDAQNSDYYARLVRRGELLPNDAALDFSLDEEDSLFVVHTPAGDAELLFLKRREDFEHAIRALAYRCEPVAIPASMGAIALNGLIDWGKIHAHKQAWLEQGGIDLFWPAEFKQFASDRSNIRGSLIILSSGYYSAITPEAASIAPNEWLDKSVTIRTYHELAHFTSRRLYPQNKEVLRDEIVADLTGLWAAFGRYPKELALLFLGIEGDGIREGGRLRNYFDDEAALPEARTRALALIDQLEAATKKQPFKDCFDVLSFIEEQRIGLSDAE